MTAMAGRRWVIGRLACVALSLAFAPVVEMNFENEPNGMDQVYEFDGLKVFVDQTSLMYLDGTQVDYVDGLEGAGFKFENPNVKSTCGCGSSFSV